MQGRRSQGAAGDAVAKKQSGTCGTVARRRTRPVLLRDVTADRTEIHHDPGRTGPTVRKPPDCQQNRMVRDGVGGKHHHAAGRRAPCRKRGIGHLGVTTPRRQLPPQPTRAAFIARVCNNDSVGCFRDVAPASPRHSLCLHRRIHERRRDLRRHRTIGRCRRLSFARAHLGDQWRLGVPSQSAVARPSRLRAA